MTGIALDSFHITPVQLQFIGNTGVTEAVEDDPRKSMLLDQPVEHRLHRRCFYWKTYRACHHKVVVLILISQGFFNEVLYRRHPQYYGSSALPAILPPLAFPPCKHIC